MTSSGSDARRPARRSPTVSTACPSTAGAPCACSTGTSTAPSVRQNRVRPFGHANLRCGQVSKSNRTGMELLRTLIRAGCPVSFSPGVREIGAFTQPSVRRCKVNIGRCDQSWTDKAVARKCRERTEYVYAGNRAFRNRDCALCNYVNETYLKCEDTRAAPSSESAGSEQVVLEEHIPFAVTLDSNRGRAIVTKKLNGVTRRKPDGRDRRRLPRLRRWPHIRPVQRLVSSAALPQRSGAAERTVCPAFARWQAERRAEIITPDYVTLPTDDNYEEEEFDDDDDLERQTEIEVVDVSVSTSATLVPQCPLVPVNNSDFFPVRKRIAPDHIDAEDSGFDRVHAAGFRSVRLRSELPQVPHPASSPRLQLPPQPLPPLQLHHVSFRLLPALPLLHPRHRHSRRHLCSRDHIRRLLIGAAQQHRRQVRLQLLRLSVRRATVLPLRHPVLERVSGSDRMLHNIGSGPVRLPVGILLVERIIDRRLPVAQIHRRRHFRL